MRAAWKPEGAQEDLLVDWMIQALWRLRRLGHVEAGIFSWKQHSILADRASRQAGTYERSALTAFSDAPEPLEITDPEKHQQAVADAEQMRARSNEPTATIGLTFIRAASAFTTLSRYEAAIHRGYYRALHELQRLQHARLSGHVPPPLALDVTVTGQDDGGADAQSGRLDSDGQESRDPQEERGTDRVEEHTEQRPAEPERGIHDELLELFFGTKP